MNGVISNMELYILLVAWVIFGGCFGIGFGLGFAGIIYLFASLHIVPVKKEKKQDKEVKKNDKAS